MARTISDDAVRAKTGKTWKAWFSTLDKAGAKNLSHKEIAVWLSKRGLPGWWAQTVTVAYERARRRRPVGQTTTGWQVSVQKTLVTGREDLWALLTKPSTRSRWLGAKGAMRLQEGRGFALSDGITGEVRAVRGPGLLRLGWVSRDDARSTLEITLSEQKGGKTAIRFRHHGIASEAERAELRERWIGAITYFTTVCAN